MADQPRRCLLMLCFHYPPGVSGGVERSARFAARLKEFGWAPIVVTTNRFGSGGGRSGERVVRTGEFLRRASAPRGPAGRGAANRLARGGGLRRAFIRFAEKWLLIPDKHVRWTLMAFAPALRILKRGEADALYTSSPPASSHVLGRLLKRLTGKPWIMDLRDPWTLEPLEWYLRAGGPRLSLERRIERECFAAADAIIASTPEAASRYAELYPRAAGKIHAIPNGFDAQELEAARVSAAHNELLRSIGADVFVVGHVGTFCRHSDSAAYPKGLLDAVEELSREGLVSPRNFRVIFAGGMNPETRRLIAGRGLGEIVATTGPVSHLDALRIVWRSDLLLLYDPNREGKYYVHGKLYEYLASGRAILGVVPEGASRALLDRSGRGIMIANDDPGEIRRALLEGIGKRGAPSGRADFDVSRYEGRYLTSVLERIIDGAGR